MKHENSFLLLGFDLSNLASQTAYIPPSMQQCLGLDWINYCTKVGKEIDFYHFNHRMSLGMQSLLKTDNVLHSVKGPPQGFHIDQRVCFGNELTNLSVWKSFFQINAPYLGSQTHWRSTWKGLAWRGDVRPGWVGVGRHCCRLLLVCLWEAGPARAIGTSVPLAGRLRRPRVAFCFNPNCPFFLMSIWWTW